MIDLHSWTTPNGRKASIMLEETGLDYRVHPVDITKDEQFAASFLAISPNNKIPAIVDHDPADGGAPISVFESAAICYYLDEKSDAGLTGTDVRSKAAVSEWTFFQMASVGPMLGQLGHFAVYADQEVPYAIERYAREARRLLGVIERQLGANDHLAGAAYSVADICTYPWLKAAEERLSRKTELSLKDAPATRDWLSRIGDRPAVRRGMAVPRA